MAQHWAKTVLTVAAFTVAPGCASVLSSTESTVQISTNPPKAHCDLKGLGGFTAGIETPASVTIPSSAAPVIVTCVAEGRKPTSYTLDAAADGWIWGNSALVMVTGGAAVLGLLVDEGRGAGKSYAETVNYDLDPDRPRSVHTLERGGGNEMTLQAR